jgi:SAM-dependent methyltransferase
LLDREFYFYEGVHFGPRVQSWLYDQWAKTYDKGKHDSQVQDDEMLARPLLDQIKSAALSQPLILDFATGTGRLSYVLLQHPEFDGHIIALDLSLGMLEKAAAKLRSYPARVEFLRHQTLPLPFPDGAFDVVCALEVLELFPNMEAPMAEFARVLRPGGILLTSRGTEASGRKAKVKGASQFAGLLERSGFGNANVLVWWKFFDRVFASRNGFTAPVGMRNLSELLRCSGCGQIRWRKELDSLACENCGNKLSSTAEGIVLNELPRSTVRSGAL